MDKILIKIILKELIKYLMDLLIVNYGMNKLFESENNNFF